ncbi:MFS transporter [Nocardia sp. NPDC059246]|uniref:MFS transporter n=1 Tax=unclassified Nocardia TaxID=2637762 RepID=UPI003698A2A8
METSGARSASGPYSKSTRSSSSFGSLRFRNFRLMASSTLLSGVGYWMGLTAQSWLVLSLTGSAADVGLTAAFLFLPSLVLGLAGGVLADRYPKRRVLVFGYVAWSSLSALLASLTLSHVVQAWHVQLIAAGIGSVNALCWPAQSASLAEMVDPASLRNAISINSSGTQLSALAGPAVGGLLTSSVGPGGAFLVAAVCYAVPILAMTRIRAEELHTQAPVPSARGQMGAGLRYAASRPDVLLPTILIALYGMFTGNNSVTLAVFAKSVFDSGSGGYGLLTSTVAIGSLIGALISARLHRTRLRTLVMFAATLSALYMLSSVAPTQLVFCAVLLCIGANTLLLQTSTNSTVQLAAHGSIRGRIVGIYLLAWSGGIAIGGPLVGNVNQHLGPRAGMLLAGVLPGVVTLLIALRLAIHLRRSRHSLKQVVTDRVRHSRSINAAETSTKALQNNGGAPCVSGASFRMRPKTGARGDRRRCQREA